jgi:hypothetical protein
MKQAPKYEDFRNQFLHTGITRVSKKDERFHHIFDYYDGLYEGEYDPDLALYEFNIFNSIGKVLGKTFKWLGKKITMNGYLTGILTNMLSVKARIMDGLLDKYRAELERGVFQKASESGKIDELVREFKKRSDNIAKELEALNNKTDKRLDREIKSLSSTLDEIRKLSSRKEKRIPRVDRTQSEKSEEFKNIEMEIKKLEDKEDEVSKVLNDLQSKKYDDDKFRKSDLDDINKIKNELDKLMSDLISIKKQEKNQSVDPAPNRIRLKQYQMEAERLWTEGKERKENERLKEYWERNLTKLKSDFAKYFSSDEMSPGENNTKRNEELSREIDKLIDEMEDKLSKVGKIKDKIENADEELNSEFKYADVVSVDELEGDLEPNVVYILTIFDGKIAIEIRHISDSKLFSIQSVGTPKIKDEKDKRVIEIKELDKSSDVAKMFAKGTFLVINWNAENNNPFKSDTIDISFYGKDGSKRNVVAGKDKKPTFFKEGVKVNHFQPKIKVDDKGKASKAVVKTKVDTKMIDTILGNVK